jgi:hypothetical protein
MLMEEDRDELSLDLEIATALMRGLWSWDLPYKEGANDQAIHDSKLWPSYHERAWTKQSYIVREAQLYVSVAN